MELLILLLVVGAIFGGLGSYVAAQRGRSEGEGAVLGFLFGPLGVLIVLLLPVAATPVRKPREPRPSPWDRYADDPAEEQAYGYLADLDAKAKAKRRA